jgi:hypothetical protein
LEKYVKFNTKVERAVWNEDEGIWQLTIVGPDGVRFEDACEVLANGSGILKYMALTLLEKEITDTPRSALGSIPIYQESKISRANLCIAPLGIRTMI